MQNELNATWGRREGLQSLPYPFLPKPLANIKFLKTLGILT